MKTYTELMQLPGYEERLEYLKMQGKAGEETFGAERYLNQVFYKSPEWRRVRDQVIVRDLGCDMALEGFELQDEIIIHHMNPINVEDITERNEDILNPEYLVCVSKSTHNLIHYGADARRRPLIVERTPNDMAPWKTKRS